MVAKVPRTGDQLDQFDTMKTVRHLGCNLTLDSCSGWKVVCTLHDPIPILILD